jgi:putative transcriptional regulator
MTRKWLIDIRNQIKKKQLEVAKCAKISEAYYCQIEKGNRNPSIFVAKKIAETLNFDWTIFFED